MRRLCFLRRALPSTAVPRFRGYASNTQPVEVEPSQAFGKARCTEEGILIHEASPYRDSCHTVWGSILWDAGLALAKFFEWCKLSESTWQDIVRNSGCCSVLELGSGTGVAGLALARLLPAHAEVTLTDYEPEVLRLLSQNIKANDLSENVRVSELQWNDRSTHLTTKSFDLVIAADVLYGGRDRWFARALIAHLKSKTRAYVAIPPRRDSPLSGFLTALRERSLCIERFEDMHGRNLGDATGIPAQVFAGGRFNVLDDERCKEVAATAVDHDAVHIFRITRPS